MKYNKKSCFSFLLAIFLGINVCNLLAQETVTTTGGNATGNGGTASFSVGQVVYQTLTGTSGSVSEGVQQPYEIFVVTGIEEAKGITLSVSAYPNPSTDYLTLEVDAAILSIQSMIYQLFDTQGKLLQSEKITGKQTSIVMSILVPATYFVKVIQENKEVKTFKIIKN